MAIEITIQYIENYDLDNVNPDGYWKFKGGSTRVIHGHDDRPANAVAQVQRDLMKSSHSHGIEYVSEWRLIPADATPFEFPSEGSMENFVKTMPNKYPSR